MPTARRIRTLLPMPENSLANMHTESSAAVSDTICRRKLRERLPKPSLKSTAIDHHYVGGRFSKTRPLGSPRADAKTKSTDASGQPPRIVSQTAHDWRRASLSDGRGSGKLPIENHSFMQFLLSKGGF